MTGLDLLPPVDIPTFRAEDAAGHLRKISDRALRPEVRAEWHALIERVELGQLPAGMDLVTAYFGATSSLLDYLPAGTLVLFDDQRAVMAVMSDIAGHAEELREAFVANGELPDGLLRPYSRRMS